MNCIIETCDNPTRSRGWCRSHYEKWRRHGDPLAEPGRGNTRKAPPVLPLRTCKNCKKVKPIEEYYVTKGWTYVICKQCHRDKKEAQRMQDRLDNPPKPRQKVDHGDCAYDDCPNKGVVRLRNGPVGWYCIAHWMQWSKNQELKTLRPQGQSYIDERFRRCTKCAKVKTHNEFHNRVKGKGKQSVCKACTLLATRFNVLLLAGRYEEALAKAEEMPELMKKHYMARLAAQAA